MSRLRRNLPCRVCSSLHSCATCNASLPCPLSPRVQPYCDICFTVPILENAENPAVRAAYRKLQHRAAELKAHLDVIERKKPRLAALAFIPETDVTIIALDGSKSRAHRAVLIRESVVLASLLGNGIGSAICNKLIMEDMDPKLVSPFVQFFYTSSISEEVMKKHANLLLKAAHRYEVALLKEKVQEHLANTVTVENALSLHALAKSCGAAHLEDKALRVMMSNTTYLTSESSGYKKMAAAQPELIIQMYESLVQKLAHQNDGGEIIGTE